MGFFNSATIPGKSREDGTTDRTITMTRVGSVRNGFIARETGLTNPDLAQTFTHRTFEERASNGQKIRVSQTVWQWPYEVSSAPGVIAGIVVLNRNGLHVPLNCPPNVRADIRYQMSVMAHSTVGSVSKELVYDSLINGIPAV